MKNNHTPVVESSAPTKVWHELIFEQLPICTVFLLCGFGAAYLQYGYLPGADRPFPIAGVRVPIWHLVWLGVLDGLHHGARRSGGRDIRTAVQHLNSTIQQSSRISYHARAHILEPDRRATRVSSHRAVEFGVLPSGLRGRCRRRMHWPIFSGGRSSECIRIPDDFGCCAGAIRNSAVLQSDQRSFEIWSHPRVPFYLVRRPGGERRSIRKCGRSTAVFIEFLLHLVARKERCRTFHCFS